MATLKANHGVITSVKKTRTKKGVLKYLITTSNGAQHWAGVKFVENYLFAYDLEGKSPLTAMIGARATWQEQKVNAGDPVLDADGKAVIKDGEPQIYKQSGTRYEQLDVVPSEALLDRRSALEDDKGISAKFAGVNIFSQVGAPVAAVATKKDFVPADGSDDDDDNFKSDAEGEDAE